MDKEEGVIERKGKRERGTERNDWGENEKQNKTNDLTSNMCTVFLVFAKPMAGCYIKPKPLTD